MEYFIVEEGNMWGQILEILAQKAAEGVEVRVMYDGMCEFSLLSHDYPKRLQKLGIQCKMFSPVTPFISTHYNYRDHRKILVIDGHTAFNGGGQSVGRIYQPEGEIRTLEGYCSHAERGGGEELYPDVSADVEY